MSAPDDPYGRAVAPEPGDPDRADADRYGADPYGADLEDDYLDERPAARTPLLGWLAIALVAADLLLVAASLRDSFALGGPLDDVPLSARLGRHASVVSYTVGWATAAAVGILVALQVATERAGLRLAHGVRAGLLAVAAAGAAVAASALAGLWVSFTDDTSGLEQAFELTDRALMMRGAVTGAVLAAVAAVVLVRHPQPDDADLAEDGADEPDLL